MRLAFGAVHHLRRGRSVGILAVGGDVSPYRPIIAVGDGLQLARPNTPQYHPPD